MIHPTKNHRLIPFIAVFVALVLLTGTVHAASVVLGYGGTTSTNGAGVYPVQATGNSERYFRCILSIGNTEVLTNLSITGVNGTTQLFPKPNGNWNDASDGVTRYLISGGTTAVWAYTIGPYVGRDIYGNQHCPTQSIGTVAGQVGEADWPFTFYATTVPTGGGTATQVASGTGTYRTQSDNGQILDWWSGSASGVDPISVDGPVAGADYGSSSNAYTFRVQYRVLPSQGCNLLPRFGTSGPPPGPEGNYANFDRGKASAYVSNDWQYDFWTYSGGLVGGASPTGDYSDQYPRYDDFGDTTGFWRGNTFPEVVLIIDGDRTRPHMMLREDPADSNAMDNAGIRYFYKFLPTDYANFMDQLFMFPYDAPGPDPQDAYQTGVHGRAVSNNYVSMQVGGHTYEFLAAADFSPPDGNRVWLNVGRPGHSEDNQYMRPVIGGGGQMEVTQVQTRFNDTDGASGGYGYPYDSQNGSYPLINPMLTAHPYFPRGTITPNQVEGALTVNPAGAAPNPFKPESELDIAGTTIIAGPNPPVRVTNDDTILPNFVNIHPDTSAAPFRGGKWTSSSTFTLRTNYWQSANHAPEYIRAMVRKNPANGTPGVWHGYTMEKAVPGDTNYTDGCVYQYLLTPDQMPDLGGGLGGGPGDYNYYFLASDGNGVVSFPNRPAQDPLNGNIIDPGDLGVPAQTDGANDYYAFRVNRAPALSSQAIVDEVGNPFPVGRSGDNFTFNVTYTDPDGEMRNAASQGDRPFETSLYLDLFGSELGQATLLSVQNATTLVYKTEATRFYATNELAGCTLEVQEGPAVGSKYSIASNTGSTIVIVGGSLLTPTNVGSNRRIRITKWFHGTMNAQDPTDNNYVDGKLYQWNSATHVVLGPGVHHYYFEFVDDWGSWLYPDDTNVRVEGEKVRFPFTGEFEGPEVLANTPPQLRDFRFTPHALNGADGTTATPFIFSVTYADQENNPPATIRVGVDGTADAPAIILSVKQPTLSDGTPADKVYSDGAIFLSDPVKLTEGTHVFRAQASDGSLRFPNVAADQPFIFSGPHQDEADDTSPLLDSAPGPQVAANTPPSLSFPSTDNNVTDPLNPPGLDPNSGRQTTEFTYSITYIDTDRFAGVAGNPPDYVQVYIDNVAHTMQKVDSTDNDYTDGALYQFKITGLTEATPHTYFFVASDGLDRARKPAQGATPARYQGPVVDEPPGAPQSLLAQDTPNDNGGQIDLSFNASVDDGGGAGDVTQYRIYRSTTSGSYVLPAVATINATGAPTYVYRDTSAVTNQDYYYVVRAWDAANESVNSNEAGPVKALDTIQPLPPSNVTATDPGLGGTISVTWNPSPDDGGGQGDVKEYHVYRATTATGFGGTFLTPAVPAGTTTFSDTTVADNTNYYYMVRSFDGANESVDSNVAGPTKSTDQQPPVIADLSPANRAVDVPIATAISFTAADSGTGVDQNSVLVTVNNVSIPLTSLTITGNPAKLTVEYQPGFTEADYRKVITVTAQASDRGGKQSAVKTWKFTLAGPTTYSISGTVLDSGNNPRRGVTVSAGDLSAVTDAAGNYLITGLVQGPYVVTPRLRHVTFTPSNQMVTVDADVTGIDFQSAAGFDITGRVVDKNGNGMQGVSVSTEATTTITDGNGYWKMLDVPAGTYSVVPALDRYAFEPQLTTVTVGPSATGIRFVGKLQTFGVNGVITANDGSRLQYVSVDATSSEGTKQATTDAAGQYSLTGLLPGRWTITPRKANYVFKPQTQTVDVSANVSEINYMGIPVYNLDLPAGLSFIALPTRPEDSSPLSVFGLPSEVPFWRYDPSIANWAVSNGTWEGLKVLPGRGFFVAPARPTTLAVPGTPVAANQAISLTLIGPSGGRGDGWNMVGNPYDAPLPWSNVGVTSGSVVRDFAYIYDRSTGSYLLITDLPGVGGGTTIPKNSGMWMRALSTQTVPISPVSSTAAARQEAWTRTAGEFVIPIVAQAGEYGDGCARVGVLNYAKGNPQAYAIDNPPAGSGYVDVFFTGSDGRVLTCDIRGEAAESQTFSFAVKTDLKNTVVKLSLPDLSQVSRDKAITLVDVATGKRIYARTLNTYTYNSGSGEARQFRLEIAPAGHGGLALTTSPAEVKGNVVGLTYTLSKPATVEVTILNLSGRTVRVVASGQAGVAGANTAAWDLRNQMGSRVPAGRYLIRVQAASDDGQQVTAVAPLNVP